MLAIARRWMCIALFASACASSTSDAPASWSTVFADLDRVALSVWSGRAEQTLPSRRTGTPLSSQPA
jgi:hypothetical protein